MKSLILFLCGAVFCSVGGLTLDRFGQSDAKVIPVGDPACVMDAGETLFDIPCTCACEEEQVCWEPDTCPAPPDDPICDCCAGQVRVSVRYVPPDCEVNIEAMRMGNTTKVFDAPNQIEEVVAAGHVHFDGQQWQVSL